MQIRFLAKRGADSPLFSGVKSSFSQKREEHTFLYRADGYFYNKKQLQTIAKTRRSTIIYTDDEQMLRFANYNEKIHNYNVMISFNNGSNFIALSEIHPNLRKYNDLVSMFLKGVLFEDWEVYRNNGQK